MIATLFVTLGLVLCVSVATAQERITPDEFLDRAAGRTLTFRHFPSDALVGVEQFLSRSKSVWTRSDGTCTYGEITRRDMFVCFRYDDERWREHCWVPFLADGMLMVRNMTGDTQRVTDVTRRPVTCRDAPMS